MRVQAQNLMLRRLVVAIPDTDLLEMALLSLCALPSQPSQLRFNDLIGLYVFIIPTNRLGDSWRTLLGGRRELVSISLRCLISPKSNFNSTSLYLAGQPWLAMESI